ncbi:hypothetical protein CR513_45963, partial [Mucuna pruriens]
MGVDGIFDPHHTHAELEDDAGATFCVVMHTPEQDTSYNKSKHKDLYGLNIRLLDQFLGNSDSENPIL